MSTRTLVEINHDYLAEIEERGGMGDFLKSLRGTEPRPPYGVKVLAQRHHSDPEFALDPSPDTFAIALHSDGTSTNLKAYALAVRFHEAYERLAPDFGYETRPETREFDSESKNGRLMIAVCDELLKEKT